MRYSLRTLLIMLAVLPPLIAVGSVVVRIAWTSMDRAFFWFAVVIILTLPWGLWLDWRVSRNQH
jgi:hypothetical protein